MIRKLKIILQTLEDSMDPKQQDAIDSIYRKSFKWEPVEKLPLICTYPYPETHTLQPFPHSETFENPEKMLFNELVHAFNTSIFLHKEIQDDLPYTIRANFGTVIIASLFGGKVEQRGNNPPWVKHFESTEEFKSVLEREPYDFSQGICPKVIERYKYYGDVLNYYPNLKKCIKLVLPDLQGPLDTLELLRGSKVYEDFILEPEMTERGLHLMSLAQVGFARQLQPFISDSSDGFSHQHANAIKGNILIRNDSAIMISPEMYARQVAKHDEFVLKEMGGGGIHSCGRIDYNIPEIFRLSSMHCFDFGQSHLNDTDRVYALAKERKIAILRIKAGKDELLSGRIRQRFPTGVSLIYEAESFEEVKETMRIYSYL